MVEYRSFLSEHDSLEISYVTVIPDVRPRAVMLLVHGMCGCKERFLPFMHFLASRGIVCFANDHRGHGDSVKAEEDRGYMYSGGYRALVDDMRQLEMIARIEYPGLPLYMVAHSMGTLAARTFMKKYPGLMNGVILCGSPAYTPMSRAGKTMEVVARGGWPGRFRPQRITRLVSRRYNRAFADEGPQAWTCSDPQVRKDFSENPKTDFCFTLNGMNALMGMMREAYSDEDWTVLSPDMPVIFLSGQDDPCMGGRRGLDRAVMVMRSAGYRNVIQKTYPAMRHEILNEIGKERVWQDILMFLGL